MQSWTDSSGYNNFVLKVGPIIFLGTYLAQLLDYYIYLMDDTNWQRK